MSIFDAGVRFEMASDGFADVLIELVDGVSLGKDVFPNPPCTPRLTVVIDCNLYKQGAILSSERVSDQPDQQVSYFEDVVPSTSVQA
jgi:hypothetical protein